MSETKFTKGPWIFVEENIGKLSHDAYHLLHGQPGDGGWEKPLYIAVGCSMGIERELGAGVAEANAHLIAAAPELYEALDEMVERLERNGWSGADIDKANAALARARGASQ